MSASTVPTPCAIRAQLCEKEQAVADVTAGRATPLEAATRFRRADGTGPEADGETACRAVIGWVHLALSHRPERAERVAGRLERELQYAIAPLGRLSVPA
jgi:hypothetical protein